MLWWQAIERFDIRALTSTKICREIPIKKPLCVPHTLVNHPHISIFYRWAIYLRVAGLCCSVGRILSRYQITIRLFAMTNRIGKSDRPRRAQLLFDVPTRWHSFIVVLPRALIRMHRCIIGECATMIRCMCITFVSLYRCSLILFLATTFWLIWYCVRYCHIDNAILYIIFTTTGSIVVRRLSLVVFSMRKT